jgi:CRP/FNR family transcriptional regulator
MDNCDLCLDQDPVSAPAARITLAELGDLLGARGPAFDETLSREWLPLRSVQQDESVYRAGDRFQSLYVVRSGFLKTRVSDGNGGEQVLGFPMRGDTIGMDGIASGSYGHDAVAMDAVVVVILGYQRFMRIARLHPVMACLFCSIFSREMSRANDMICLLGGMSAPERLAAFLLYLSRRYAALGYSNLAFHLRMRREEIASHLGLAGETVSRNFSLFTREGLIAVTGDEVRIRDLAGLKSIANEAMRDRAPGPGSGTGPRGMTRPAMLMMQTP